MAKNVKRKLSEKQLKRAYANYVKRYKTAKTKLSNKGLEMASEMMSESDYRRTRALYVAEGTEININQTIVADQKYLYNRETARRFKKTAKEGKTYTIQQIRAGAIDVSAINEYLKEIHEDWTGYQRAAYISNEVFGSD